MMCGILGAYGNSFDEEFAARFERALNLLKHRGPDGWRLWPGNGVLFGHTRLSIVDLSEQSAQPMADRSGRYRIVFNGEIYNYQEVREELRRLGVDFRTLSDTEVILEAYKRWGRECQFHFNGMWAFAIYDGLENELFLSRDRYGVKPLYYAVNEMRLVFGSEMKALLALGVDAEPDWGQVGRFALDTGIDWGSDTLFKNIRMLPAGHCMLATPHDRRIVMWWDIAEQRVAIPDRFDERVARFRELFEDAVRLRLRNDVNTGVSLSGGMDSSSVYGAARRLQQRNAVRSATSGEAKSFSLYTISYPDSTYNEYAWVEKGLRFWNDQENVSVVYPEPEMFPKMIDEVIWHQEVPVWTPTVFAFHALYRHIAASGTRVVLEGHGSDELLAGYHEMVLIALQTYASRNDLRMTWKASQCYAEILNPVWGQGNQRPLDVFLRSYLPARRLLRLPVQIVRSLWPRPDRPPVNQKGYISPDILAQAAPEPPPACEGFSDLNRDLLLNFTRRHLPTILRVVDRASMAYSVESRLPFMDFRIVEYAFSLPDEDKVARRNKVILRQAAVDWLPEKVIDRKAKMPFSLEEREWFNSPIVREYLSDIFHSSDAAQSDLLKGKMLSDDLDGVLKRGITRYDAIRIWKALNLYLWKKSLVDPYRR